MKKSRIAAAKNHLSRLIDDVKRGETVLILDRDTPVARLEPVSLDPGLGNARMSALVAQGVLVPPRRQLDVARLLSLPVAKLPPGASAVGMMLEEREAGR